MKKVVLTALFVASASSALAGDWTFNPKLYVRGGFTQSADLNAKGDGVSPFNAQGWNETNAFQNNLTELDLHAMYKDKAKIVYGINVDSNERFEVRDAASSDHNGLVKERQAYIEMYKAVGDKGTLWFGRRPYRGFGDYMDGTFPLDERNMFGGGIMLDNVGVGRYEVAYATNDELDTDGTGSNDKNFFTNFLLNKYIIGIDNGNITLNGEIHQNHSTDDMYKSYGYMIGGQYARWNMSLLGAKWYNIFVLNYSHGHLGGVDAGEMNSAFDSKKKNEQAQKLVFKIGGDLKSSAWSMFYTIKYQNHMGDQNNGYTKSAQNWQFTDLMIRPMYALTSNVGLGVDGLTRFVLKQPAKGTTSSDWARDTEMWRLAAVANYHLDAGGENLFQNAEISLFAGRAHHDKETGYFKGRGTSKDADFVRVKYTMEI